METNMNIDNKPQKATVRNAINIGFQLASNFAEYLENEHIPPFNWPEKISLSLKHIKKLPEVDGNIKVANRVKESAIAIWKDMREQAINIHRDMELHPEFYIDNSAHNAFDNNHSYAWRDLSAKLEQIAGNIFINEFITEEHAKKNINNILSQKQCKYFLEQFDEDFNNYVNEIRDAIRNKKEIKATERFELICRLNVNLKMIQKSNVRKKTQNKN
jgi:hypothetical protein